ncbi:MAG: chorismate-binding protein, partial [Thermoproteota archaeon]
MVAFGQLADSSILIQKLATSEDQFELFKKLYSLYDKVFILESLIGPKELAEMSVIGFDPEVTVTCDEKKFVVKDRKGRVVQSSPVTEPLAQLRELMPKVNDDRFRYVGGAVGYINYDAVRFWENLPIKGKKNSTFPLLEFGVYQDGILYNHKENQAYYFFLGKSRLAEIERKIAKVKNEKQGFSYSTPRRNMTKQRFVKMVKKAKRYVYDGDVFQVVLAKSINFKISGSMINLYESLREVNPSPYMYLLKMSNRCIIGSSPEMLIRVTNDYVETFPIAGTRPIVEDEKRNEELRQDLLKDEKEL